MVGGVKVVLRDGIVPKHVISTWGDNEDREYITSLEEFSHELSCSEAEYQWIPNFDLVVQSNFKKFYPNPERWAVPWLGRKEGFPGQS